MTTVRRACAALTLCAVAACPVQAISDEEIFRDFPFNLINPGARARGLGGAFISLADDSSAAQANPAGLMQLRRPELFAELRAQTFDPSSTTLEAQIDGEFFQGMLATGARSEPEDSFTPTFLSYVHPFERIAIGVSRLESLEVKTRTRNEFSIEGNEAIVEVDPDTGRPEIIGFQAVDFDLAADADADLSVVQWNLVLAAQLHRKLFLGITGVVGVAEIDGRVDNTFQDGVTFTQPTLDYATRIDDSDTDVSFNAGLLWKPTDWINVGAVYRGGLRFELQETVSPQGVRADVARDLYGAEFDNVLRTPDSYGVGISFRPAEPWTVLVDVVEIEYSDLLEDYVSGLNRISFPSEGVAFTVDDATEVHVGLERIFLAGTTPIAGRIGAWTDPDNRIRAADTTDLIEVFPAGDDEMHYTAGIGVTLKQAIQIDAAVDVSDVSTQFVVSTIYRF